MKKEITTTCKTCKHREKFIEVQKMKRFSMAGALKFWDNFDVELYRKILIKKKQIKIKNNEKNKNNMVFI